MIPSIVHIGHQIGTMSSLYAREAIQSLQIIWKQASILFPIIPACVQTPIGVAILLLLQAKVLFSLSDTLFPSLLSVTTLALGLISMIGGMWSLGSFLAVLPPVWLPL